MCSKGQAQCKEARRFIVRGQKLRGAVVGGGGGQKKSFVALFSAPLSFSIFHNQTKNKASAFCFLMLTIRWNLWSLD